MISVEELLSPISGSNPGGADLRYEPVYADIKEARRQDDGLPKGVWKETGELKTADYRKVIRLCRDALAHSSKDLQLAAWMTEALVHQEGFRGLQQGLALVCGLLEKFWDSLYPEIEDGDIELRAAPIEWIDNHIAHTCRTVALTEDGYNWYQYQDSRKIPSEKTKSDVEKKEREKAIKEGKVTPENFDLSLHKTPKAFYVSLAADLRDALKGVAALETVCRTRFGDAAPGAGRLRSALEEILERVDIFLEEKRKLEPDPEPAPPEAAPELQGEPVRAEETAPEAAAVPLRLESFTASEPADRRQAIAAVAAAAAFLRKREPTSPAPYLMMRGLRWGELRAAASISDASMLEAPSVELRVTIKTLALKRRWKELLETAESAMALPCSRAWLDLQRVVVEACEALGGEYRAIAQAVRSELKALLLDIPELLDATLMDDTPAANPETKAWARALLDQPAVHSSNGSGAAWQRKSADAYDLATEAYQAGQPQRAFEILYEDLQRQRSGRGRFRRKLQLAELCVQAGKEAVAQPLLDDIAAALENHKLEDWEDRELVCSALLTLMQSSKKIQGDAKEKQKLFERVCRLDPVKALYLG